ncbi:6-phosphogluconolactonase [Synechocystis sp. PCC 7509]|uniref:6-phosphogluconolactonase n=1 Tax=Synechocystis sp. PCC 7509 TaxID=927677 RepID=UPI0002ACA747|nr:6-phosphogluconolactonase [Synechocystis sp. PCC 7509]
MEKIVEVLPSLELLIERSLAIILDRISDSIAERGFCAIALAGGSTPKPLYEAISKQSLPWNKIHVFWGDERYVAPEHPDSNQLMARKAWLNKVPIPATNIHPMPTKESDPHVAASIYEQELLGFFQLTPGELPVFDVILLGIGDDGHTASLFPHTDALKVSDRAVTVGSKDGQPRITFTYTLINQARCVMFLVAGSSKKAALAQIFAPIADNYTYPSRFIQPQGKLWWLLDGSAGQEVPSKSA